MTPSLEKFDHLLADDGPAAITLMQWLKPVWGEVIYPPTYANPSQNKSDPSIYNIDKFNVDGKEHSVCVIDSIPSQANRIEPELGRLTLDGKPVKLVPKVTVKATVNDKSVEVDLLKAGHRAADAVVRYSSLATELGKAIDAYAHGNAVPLARLGPTSLVHGMWDSRESGVKIPRLLSSIIRAYDVVELHRSAQYNAALDYEAAGVVGPGKKLSEVGMDNALATFQHGGIEARSGIRRDAYINLCTVRDLQGGTDVETKALQRYILGLALVGLTWFDGKPLNLRQGCHLVSVPDKPMQKKLVKADGTEQPFEISHAIAVKYAAETAQAFGIADIHDRQGTFDAKAATAARKKKDKKEAES